MLTIAKRLSRYWLAIALVFPGWSGAMANTTVDLELVLAVDVSLSMDSQEQSLQRDGFVSAFRDPRVIEAIQSGPTGRIAVTYLEWGGRGLQTTIVPWRVIGNGEQALAFARELEAKPVHRERRTSISEALLAASRLFDANDIDAPRRVIDVSGDGPNNDGQPVAPTRDLLVERGIVVNGLAIQVSAPHRRFGYFDLPDLDQYYSACVIGGVGSFVLPIRSLAEFSTAIRRKLLLEIAGNSPVPANDAAFDWAGVPDHDALANVHPAQFKLDGRPSYDCMIGEKRWRQFSGD